MKFSTLFKAMSAIVLGIVMGMYFTPAFAVDGVDPYPPNLFELDGNPADDSGPGLPDDWNTLYLLCDENGQCPGGVPYEFTGIIADGIGESIYTKGGSKDVHDISDWWHKDGSVPDKDEILNAFAAAYVNPSNICYSSSGYDSECDDTGTEIVHFAGDQIIYFGFDRFDNSGDAFGGFWFLINEVDLDENRPGRFSDAHVAKTATSRGDILILVEYPQASGAIPVIKAYEWDPDLLGDPNEDENGKDIGPLEMIYNSEDQSNTARCDGLGDKLACAITNESAVDTPAWDYQPKGGALHDPLPHETFYSGGVNLTQLLGGQNICVSTFLAETRSSRSETAQLKDFVLGGFSLCGSEVITMIYDGEDNPIGFPAFEEPEAVMAGTQIHDVATVTFTGPGIQMDPTGFVDFYLYDDKTCGLDPNNPDDPPAAPRATTLNVAVEAGDPNDNMGTAESASFGLPAAQCYSFHAEFRSGHAEFPGAVLEDALCEWVCIDKYPSKIRTEIHKDGGHDNITFGQEPVQTTMHDHAYVEVDGTFPGAPMPTGTVTFNLWKNKACAPIENPFTGSFGDISWPQNLIPLSGGEAETDPFTPSAGSFGILAKYSGDDNYDPSDMVVADCEYLEIFKLDPIVETMVMVRDLAQVSRNKPEDPMPTGTVTFKTYRSDDCTGEAKTFGPIEISGTGAGEQGHDLEELLTDVDNAVSYFVTYSGDGNYEKTDHKCELVKFSVLP